MADAWGGSWGDPSAWGSSWGATAEAEFVAGGPQWVPDDPGNEWACDDPGREWKPDDPGNEWVCEVGTKTTLKKRSAWRRRYTINLSRYAEIVAGATIDSVSDVRTTPTDIVEAGAAAINAAGDRFQFWIDGGADGTEYAVIAEGVVLSDGTELEIVQALRVED